MNYSLTKPQKTLIVCSVFIAGTATFLLNFNLYFLLTTLVLLLFLTWKQFISGRFLIICLIIYLFSILYTDFRQPDPDILNWLSPSKSPLKGRVITEPRKDLENKTKFYFKVNYIKNNDKWFPVSAKTLVTIYDKKRKFDEIKLGDILEINGTTKRPYEPKNPGQFDYKKYLNNQGVFSLTYVGYKGYEILDRANSGYWLLARKTNDLKNKIIDIHRQNLESPKLEVLGGMVFGDHAVPVPEDVENNFINSGLLHLLAASGLNVGIIFGVWFFLASKIKIPYKSKIICGMLLIIIYSLLTGLPPSVTRAALMLEFVLLGKLMDRKADSVSLLLIVCALMLLFDPLMITNVGFQLSFIVTFGLLFSISVLVEKSKPIPEFLSAAVLVPVIAQVFAAPIQIFHFNTFAFYSVPANIIVLPFVGIISAAGFSGSICSLIPFIGEKLCFICDKIAEPFVFLLLYIAEFVSKLPESLQYSAAPDIPVIFILYILLILIIGAVKKDFSLKSLNNTILIMILVAIIFVFKGNLNLNKNLEFVFFDVGEGDSIFIKTPEKKYILVDTGPGGIYSPAKYNMVPFLKEKGINKLDILLLTHPDYDHIGGTPDIIDNIKINKIFHNGIKNDTKTYKAIFSDISQKNINTEILNSNDFINIDDNLKIQAIRPDNIDFDDDNEDSIILYIVYKDFSALLMADCEADSLNDIKQTVNKPVSLLKVGHHGSHNSVNQEFLDYIMPKISVISVGKKGYSWGHPNSEVLDLLKKSGTKTLRTDKNFAITVTTNGQETIFKTFRNNSN